MRSNGTAGKTCLNPNCKRVFQPGHYGDRQKVCLGGARVACRKCHGNGSVDHRKCPKCQGKGKVWQTCKLWYKTFWSQTRKPPRGIADADYRKILREFRSDLQFQTLIVVAYESGMRKGELLGLIWSDLLDRDRKIREVVTLRGQWDDCKGFKPTKTGAGRLVYLGEESLRFLKRYMGWFIDTQGGLGLQSDKRVWPLTESGTWSRFTKAQRRLKIQNLETAKPFRFHDLRHSAGVNTLQATGRLDRVQSVLGHKNPATSIIYAQERPEDVAASLKAAFRKRAKKR